MTPDEYMDSTHMRDQILAAVMAGNDDIAAGLVELYALVHPSDCAKLALVIDLASIGREPAEPATPVGPVSPSIGASTPDVPMGGGAS